MILCGLAAHNIPPCTVRVFRFGRDRQVRYHADACQRFTSKAICRHGCQILEGFQLGCCEPFTQDCHVITLESRKHDEQKYPHTRVPRGRKKEVEDDDLHTFIPWPLSVICRSFRPPSLTAISIDVEPASTEFSISSFRAFTGATIISPAAIRFTTSSPRA